jgi:hypothetical protein
MNLRLAMKGASAVVSIAYLLYELHPRAYKVPRGFEVAITYGQLDIALRITKRGYYPRLRS